MDKETYMYYVPAFTSVVREMIRFSHNYYLSAIRYSDFERKTIFIDFGAGMGKTVIIAGETGKFELVGGLEIDPELVEYARKNLNKTFGSAKDWFLLEGNVESARDVNTLVSTVKALNCDPMKSTVFIFNKNSYGEAVMRNSLEYICRSFPSVVYLYQNPIHRNVLEQFGFVEFGSDKKATTEHKNYKYKLYYRHKNEI
jgi:predicted RNA methylase